MNKKIVTSVLAAFFCFSQCLPLSVFAEDMQQYMISGIVTNKSDESPVLDAEILISGDKELSERSDIFGYYQIEGLDAGLYLEVIPSKDGLVFSPEKIKISSLNSNRTINFSADPEHKDEPAEKSKDSSKKSAPVVVSASGQDTHVVSRPVSGVTKTQTAYVSETKPFFSSEKDSKSKNNTESKAVGSAKEVFDLSGKVLYYSAGLVGVRVMVNNDRKLMTTTDINGYYTIKGLKAGQNYNVKFSREGYIFNPSEYEIVKGDRDFVINAEASASKYKIHGNVSERNMPIDDVNIKIISGVDEYSSYTDKEGNYVIDGLPHGNNYFVSASKEGVMITPAKVIVNKLDNNRAINFNAAVQKFSINGTVKDFDDAPLKNAKIEFKTTYDTFKAVTNSKGKYILEDVPMALTYTLVASKEGYISSEPFVIESLDKSREINFQIKKDTKKDKEQVAVAAVSPKTKKTEKSAKAPDEKKQKAEQEKLEKERQKEAERQEKLDQKRLAEEEAEEEKQRIEQEKQEKKRIAEIEAEEKKQKAEQEKLEKEKQKELEKQEKLDQKRLAEEEAEEEKQRIEQEKQEQKRIAEIEAEEKKQKSRLARQKRPSESKSSNDKKQKAEQERLEKEKQKEAERQKKIDQKRLEEQEAEEEKQRIEQEKQEQKRIAEIEAEEKKQQAESERLEREKQKETERQKKIDQKRLEEQEAEEEKQRIEQEKQEQKRIAEIEAEEKKQQAEKEKAKPEKAKAAKKDKKEKSPEPKKGAVVVAGEDVSSNKKEKLVKVRGKIESRGEALQDIEVNMSHGFSTKTDERGRFELSVPAGKRYTLAPEAAGLYFEPEKIVYDELKSNMLQDFVPYITIEGEAFAEGKGVADVAISMNGFQETSTNQFGKYKIDKVEYGAPVSITASKSGVTFYPNFVAVPKAEKNLENVNFLVSYSAAGRVTMQGSGVGFGSVSVEVSGSTETSITTDYAGNFVILGLAQGGSFEITPKAGGYSFVPPSRKITDVRESFVGQNFSAVKETYSVSGNVNVGGKVIKNAVVSISKRALKYYTDDEGNFTITNLDYGGPYTVNVVSSEHAFESIVIDVLDKDTKVEFSTDISLGGIVMSGKNPVPGVIVDVNGKKHKTDETGKYLIKGLKYNGDYLLSLSAPGIIFSPAQKEYKGVQKSVLNEMFKASALINGRVTLNGKAFAGATIKISGMPEVYKSDSNGYFLIKDLYIGEDYILEISSPGYKFDPPKKEYRKLSSGKMTENFKASVDGFSIKGTVTAEGSPLKRVAVIIEGTSKTQTLTDDQGRFSFENIGSKKRYEISVLSKNHKFETPCGIIENLNSDKVIDLQPGKVTTVD